MGGIRLFRSDAETILEVCLRSGRFRLSMYYWTQYREGKMAARLEERSPEEPMRPGGLAGAGMVPLGLGGALGFFTAPLVRGDFGALAHSLRQSAFGFRIGWWS